MPKNQEFFGIFFWLVHIIKLKGMKFIMQEFFRKDIPIVEKIDINDDSDLIRNIVKTRKDLEFANNNYEFADSDLIDYYIYEIKANQAKLNYLIKMAKIKGLNVHFIKDIEYRLSTDEENVI